MIGRRSPAKLAPEVSVLASQAECVEYNGCNDGYPVIWCEYPGGHTQPSIGPDAIWAFFERF